MLTELTPKQTAALEIVRDEWLAHGLSTEPADRLEAERGVKEVYAAANLPAPELVLWLDSPMAGAFGAWALSVLSSEPEEVIMEAVGRFPALVEAVRQHLETCTKNQPCGHCASNAPDDVIMKQVKSNPSSVWSQVRDQMYLCGYGQHDASWLSFYDFFGRFCGLEEEVSQLTGAIRIGRSAGWWWPFSGAIVLTERPAEMHRDAQGRLHCETGPALRYPDDWGMHAWHGVRVEPWVIDGTATTDQILGERNVEVRRCAIEAYGWPKFIEDAKLKEVARSSDPGNPGQFLTLYVVPSSVLNVAVNVLVATNGTVERDGNRRVFGLTVPAEITDPVAAAAWGYGLDAKDYAEMARRS